jgi:hypothetical protein
MKDSESNLSVLLNLTEKRRFGYCCVTIYLGHSVPTGDDTHRHPSSASSSAHSSAQSVVCVLDSVLYPLSFPLCCVLCPLSSIISQPPHPPRAAPQYIPRHVRPHCVATSHRGLPGDAKCCALCLHSFSARSRSRCFSSGHGRVQIAARHADVGSEEPPPTTGTPWRALQ